MDSQSTAPSLRASRTQSRGQSIYGAVFEGKSHSVPWTVNLRRRLWGQVAFSPVDSQSTAPSLRVSRTQSGGQSIYGAVFEGKSHSVPWTVNLRRRLWGQVAFSPVDSQSTALSLRVSRTQSRGQSIYGAVFEGKSHSVRWTVNLRRRLWGQVALSPVDSQSTTPSLRVSRTQSRGQSIYDAVFEGKSHSVPWTVNLRRRLWGQVALSPVDSQSTALSLRVSRTQSGGQSIYGAVFEGKSHSVPWTVNLRRRLWGQVALSPVDSQSTAPSLRASRTQSGGQSIYGAIFEGKSHSVRWTVNLRRRLWGQVALSPVDSQSTAPSLRASRTQSRGQSIYGAVFEGKSHSVPWTVNLRRRLWGQVALSPVDSQSTTPSLRVSRTQSGGQLIYDAVFEGKSHSVPWTVNLRRRLWG